MTSINSRAGTYVPSATPHRRAAPGDGLRYGDVVVSSRKSFFHSVEDFETAYAAMLEMLARDSLGNTAADDDGHYPEEVLLSSLHTEHSVLSYVGHDHIVEIYMKDPSARISYDRAGLRLGHLSGGLAIPPEVLYYATTARIAARVLERGLQSPSKPFLPLSTTIEEACRKCTWFVRNSNDDMVVITIDAALAYDDHVSFSYSAKSCEFLVERLSPRYISGSTNLGKVLDDGTFQTSGEGEE